MITRAIVNKAIPQQDTQTQLLEACIEALSLFDDYPQCYESIGTYQVLNLAISNALREKVTA